MGRVAGRGYLAYGTAKAALAHYTRLAAQDLSPSIRVNAIAVGSVMTSALDYVVSDEAMMTQMTSKTPLGRVGEAEDIAAAALYLASRAGGFVTGKVIEVDGGLQQPNLDLGLPDLVAGPRGAVSDQARRRLVDRHRRSARDRRHRRPPRPRAGRLLGLQRRRRSARTPASWPGSTATSASLATNDKEALFALEPDCIVHTAMVDDRIFEAIDDLTEMVERGINVVSSGPVLLCYPQGLGLDELRRRDRRRRREDRRQPARQRHRPRAGPTTCCRWR